MTTSSYPSTMDYLFKKSPADSNATGSIGFYPVGIVWSDKIVYPVTLFRKMLIGIHPSICGGEPIILGTRISVANIIEKMDRLGYDIEKVLSDYPHLSKDQIEACLEHYAENKKEIDEILEEEKEVNE